MIGVASALWAVPCGMVCGRRPSSAFPAAVAATQIWTTGWAALNLAVFAAAAMVRARTL